jgi:hypothetical protein
MPNGGIMPSCHACKWAPRIQVELDENPFLTPIECGYHKINIFLPFSNFCSELSGRHPGWFEGFLELAETEYGVTVAPGKIYQWLELWHDGYRHEIVSLAVVEQYASWDADKALSVTRSLHAKRQNDINSSGSEQGGQKP